MITLPAFASFEMKLRDDHRASEQEAARKLGIEAPPMPEPRYRHGHGAKIKPPVGATKRVATDLPAGDFLELAEMAKVAGVPLSVLHRQIVQKGLAERRATA